MYPFFFYEALDNYEYLIYSPNLFQHEAFQIQFSIFVHGT